VICYLRVIVLLASQVQICKMGLHQPKSCEGLISGRLRVVAHSSNKFIQKAIFYSNLNFMKIILGANVAVFFILFLGNVYAQDVKNAVDTIHLDRKQLLIKYLKPGTSQYLVSFHGPKLEKLMNVSIWQRTVAFSNFQSQEAIVITQQWSSPDSAFNRSLLSVSEKATLRPIYHYAKSSRSGIEAFNFSRDNIAGADSVANNQRKNWSLPLEVPTLNWELDIEILALLPYKANKTFAVNFYHPGSKTPPKYYLYQVIGSETIEVAGQQKVDCWQLRIDYDAKSHAIFWVSKKNRELLKAMDVFGAGYRFKTKLATQIRP
jgi:hypothetical protein